MDSTDRPTSTDSPAGDSCIGYNLLTRSACGAPATETVIAGCEHEHLGERPLCDYHARDARTGLMHCGDCADSPAPHVCRLAVLA